MFHPAGSVGGSGCVSCLAVFSFLLGAFGGYLVTVTLNGNGGHSDWKPDDGEDDEKNGPSAVVSTHLDDEGNVVEKRSPPRTASSRPSKIAADEDDGAAGKNSGGKEVVDRGDDSPRGIVIVEGEEDDENDVGISHAGEEGGAIASMAPGATSSAVASQGGRGDTTTERGGGDGPIRVVVQRFRSASLLLRPPSDDCPDGFTASFRSGGDAGSDPSSYDVRCGMMLYVSFAKSAEESSVYDAASTVMNLPVLTDGKWGDGSGTRSVLALASEGYAARKEGDEGGRGGGVAVMVVPQANLISKAKNKGRSIQYHGQIDKDKGKELYEKFVQCVRLVALEQSYLARNVPVPKSVRSAIVSAGGSCSSSKSKGGGGSAPSVPDASVPPADMFRDETMYASWDDSGFPLTKANGEPTSKSARKKMKKQFEAQRKRHDKYLASGGGGAEAGGARASSESDAGDDERGVDPSEAVESAVAELDPGFISVVGGTFGNLQALELKSDMGPFCHVLNLG